MCQPSSANKLLFAQESNKPVLSVTQYEDKIRALKLKLSNDKDAHKKVL